MRDAQKRTMKVLKRRAATRRRALRERPWRCRRHGRLLILAGLRGSKPLFSLFHEFLAFSALVLATINVVGGFAVTNRMLKMIAGKRGGK